MFLDKAGLRSTCRCSNIGRIQYDITGVLTDFRVSSIDFCDYPKSTGLVNVCMGHSSFMRFCCLIVSKRWHAILDTNVPLFLSQSER